MSFSFLRGMRKGRRWFFQKGVEQELFTQLAVLLRAHIPLYEALQMIRLPEATFLASLVGEGYDLSEALRRCMIGNEMARTLIAVGEKTGTLGNSLQCLVDYQEKLSFCKAQLRAALLGPAITFLFFLVIVVGIMWYVLPQFSQYFASYGVELPWFTAWLLQQEFSPWFLTPFIGCFFMKRMFVYTHIGQEWYLSLFLQALTLLLRNGIPLSESLWLLAHSAESSLIKHEIELSAKLVDAGQQLSVALRQTLFYRQELEGYVRIGEESGELSRMIAFVADLLQQRLFLKLKCLIVWINPLLVCFLGFLIGFLMYALYMPLLNLSSVVREI